VERGGVKLWEAMQNTRFFKMAFAAVYPLYVAKAEKKGRTRQEVHAVIHWLTGHGEAALAQQIARRADFATFFAEAPRINPNVSKITGVICGYRVEEIEDTPGTAPAEQPTTVRRPVSTRAESMTTAQANVSSA